MFGMPDPTPYDLKFRFLGIPARVTPWFWLGAIMIGPHEPRLALVFIPCVLFSILVHEFGHGLMAKAFGYHPQIALFALGGLCAYEGPRQTPMRRLAILAAGPGAQFLLLLLVMVIGNAVLGVSWSEYPGYALGFLGLGDGGLSFTPPTAMNLELYLFLRWVFLFLFYINWLWPLLNLLPIWPLDGGQMTQVVLIQANPRNGARWSHIVSMLVAGLLVAFLLSRFKAGEGEGEFLRILFFAWFVLMNYQMLQAYHSRYVQHGYEDDESDWWKR
jgi:Zn-dependent protease